MDGRAFHCSENIDAVYPKGKGEEEKFYVKLKRKIFAGRFPGDVRSSGVENGLNKHLYVIDEREFVFMRDHKPDQDAMESPPRVITPGEPDFYHRIIPTRDLLFCFSALTFNAHAIHLDRDYCREVEGHRNLLVQGDLMVVLVIEVLRSYLRSGRRSRPLSSLSDELSEEPERIDRLQYQNLRPLYVDEEMKICVRRIGKRYNQELTYWEVWIEGTDGGYSFRGKARTRNASSVASRDAKDDPSDVHQESDLDEETVPDEHVALQQEVNAGIKTHSSEDAPTEDKTC